MKKKPSSGGDPRALSVTFVPGGPLEAAFGESLLNAAWRAGVPLNAPCGGQGWCGRCRVKVDPPPPPAPGEAKVLSPREIGEGWRLACRTFPRGPSTVTLPPLEGPAAALPVLEWIIAREVPPGGARGLGVALDLGTTTLAAQLWDMSSSRLAGSATAVNPQTAFGYDIISRITAAAEPDGLHRLSSSLRRGAARLLQGLLEEHGLDAGDVTEIVVAGNTTMQHFFTATDPASLARAPFQPAFLSLPPSPAAEAGLPAFPGAVVHFLPNASAFLGGDAVSGVLALDALEDEPPTLLMDMGTNAEIVLLRDGDCLAASAAAGPALEGGNISSGLRAMPGAVEEVAFQGDIVLKTLGNRPPRGLCGSGLLDLAALLVGTGFILPDGRLISPSEAGNSPWKKIAARLGTRGDENSFTVHGPEGPNPAIAVTQEDIRQIQLAKAALATGWQVLLREGGLEPRQIRKVYLSGGFGYGLRPSSLVTLGLIPPEWEGKLFFPGNTALAGAARYLLVPAARERLSSLVEAIKTRHLGESKAFQRLFIENMAFPG